MAMNNEELSRALEDLRRRVEILEATTVSRDAVDEEIRTLEARLAELRELEEG